MTITKPTTWVERNIDRRLDALEQANRVRSARALLKRRLAETPSDARLVLVNPTADYRTMRLRDLLLALPKLGPQKVDRLLFHAGIYHRKTLAGLSPRQREAALDIVAAYLANQRTAS